jgi:hypothetical protein
MAFKDFPSKLFFKVLETGEQAVVAGFTAPSSFELAGMTPTVYRLGALAGSEALSLSLYHDKAMTKLYRAGSSVQLSGLSGFATGDAWIGRVLLPFSNVQIESGETYYVAMQSSGYTRSGLAFYLALALDWPLPVYQCADAPNYPAALPIFGRVRQ